MKYDVILFDADDTLFDYGMAESHALSNAFLHVGMPTGAEDYAASYQEINHALWRDLEQGRLVLLHYAWNGLIGYSLRMRWS